MKPYTDASLTIHLNGADLSTAQEIHVVQNGPPINTWAANLKAGTTYRMAWFTLI